MRRSKARELAVKALYQLDMVGNSPDEAISSVLYACDTVKTDSSSLAFINSSVKETWLKLNSVDPVIQSHARNWNPERFGRIERAILRLAAHEILFCEEVPVGVSVNEAVELAKTYGGDDSGRFVNGVLAGLLQDRDGQNRE